MAIEFQLDFSNGFFYEILSILLLSMKVNSAINQVTQTPHDDTSVCWNINSVKRKLSCEYAMQRVSPNKFISVFVWWKRNLKKTFLFQRFCEHLRLFFFWKWNKQNGHKVINHQWGKYHWIALISIRLHKSLKLPAGALHDVCSLIER